MTSKRIIITLTLLLCLPIYLSSSYAQEKMLAGERFQNALPLYFAENNGSSPPEILYQASSPGLAIYLTKNGLTYVIIHQKKETTRTQLRPEAFLSLPPVFAETDRVEVNLKGATIQKEQVIASQPTNFSTHYFLSQCQGDQTNGKGYHQLVIKNVYPGIDWVLYAGKEKGFKYDFIVHPGADPKQIQLLMSLDGNIEAVGRETLSIETRSGTIYDGGLVSLQQSKKITTRYQVSKLKEHCSKNRSVYQVSFDIGSYNPEQVLQIDPTVTWATQLDASSVIRDVKCDALGNVYVLGLVVSTTSAILNYGSGYHQTSQQQMDILIYKFDKDGVLLWCTNYGGSGDEAPNILVISPTNEVYVTGRTDSFDLPILNSGGFLQPTKSPGMYSVDAFILKFSANSTLLWATYFGGNSVDDFTTGCFDLAGNILLGGLTGSTDLPMVNGSGYFDNSYNGGNDDGFILKFSTSDVLIHSTYLGGSDADFDTYGCLKMKRDPQGNIWLVGNTRSVSGLPYTSNGGFFKSSVSGSSDAVFAKFNTGFVLTWFSAYGGNDVDAAADLTVDQCGNVWVLGGTLSQDFPSVNAGGYMHTIAAADSLEGFIVKLNAANNVTWSTYLGGNKADWFNAIVNDGSQVYAVGFTNSTDLPHVSLGSGLNQSSNGGGEDAMLYCFDQSTTLTYASYFGNANNEEVQVATLDTVHSKLYFAGQIPSYHPIPFYLQTQPTPTSYTTAGNSANGHDDGFIVQLGIDIPNLHSTRVHDTVLCSNNELALQVTPLASDYAWSLGATTFSSSVASTGVYWVNYHSNCFSLTDTFHVTLYPVPLITMAANASIITGSSYQISATVNIPSTYTWSPGEFLSCQHCLNPLASPNQVTVYCLTAETEKGCQQTSCLTLQVQDKTCPFSSSDALPEAFTPNEDHINDVYVITGWGECLSTFNIQIFDRWGEKLFETSDPTVNWDGKYRGKYLDMGVYVYQISAMTVKNEKMSRKGTINLIR